MDERKRDKGKEVEKEGNKFLARPTDDFFRLAAGPLEKNAAKPAVPTVIPLRWKKKQFGQIG